MNDEQINNLLNQQNTISLSDNCRSQIFQNAYALLEKRRSSLKEAEISRERLKLNLAELKEKMQSFNFKLSYEYAALYSLIIIFSSLLKPETQDGELTAFKLSTDIVTSEAQQDSYSQENIYQEGENNEK